MNKMVSPRAGDWNNFWQSKLPRLSNAPSWSKKRITNVISPYVVRGKYALDAGCGSGFFSKHFCDEGMRTTSLDYSPQALNLTAELTQGRSNIIQSDLLNPEITSVINQRFDLIFTDGLLEHFKEDEQNLLLLNLTKLLRENGVVITFVPNRYSPWELIRPLYMPGIQEEPFRLDQLVSLHQRNHLTVLAKGGLNTIPIKFSPDGLLGPFLGMLLYVICKKREQSDS